MPDPSTILGVPPAVLAYILAKCAYEVRKADGTEKEKNALYLQCVFENVDKLVPTGLPDPDKYDNDDNDSTDDADDG